MGKQARLLEHKADGTHVNWPEMRAVLPHILADGAEPVGYSVQARNRAEHCCLAAARRAKYGGDPARWRLEFRIEPKAAESAPKARLNPGIADHLSAPAKRFSIVIIVKITAKEKIAMPAASILASCQREVST